MCGQLNLAHVTINKICKRKKLKQTPEPTTGKSGPRSAKAVQMEPGRLWMKGFVKQMSS